jgi:hypothetical protein
MAFHHPQDLSSVSTGHSLFAQTGALARGHYAECADWECRWREGALRLTPDDFASEAEAQFAAEKIIRKL